MQDGGVNNEVEVRSYSSRDAQPTLNVFIQAVTATASAHYTPEQVAAWSGEGDVSRTLEGWHRRRSERATIVATVDEEVAGFSDVDIEGFIGMLFVAPAYGRRGIATRLLDEIEQRARRVGADSVSVNASLVLRPLLERRGFVVDAELQPVIRGVALTSFRMVKQLPSEDA